MPLYLMLSKLTDQGRKTVRENPTRIKEVNKEVEAMGVHIRAQYALLGPYDFATVLEGPDNWSISRVALELGARGTIDTTTMPAMEIDEFIRYLAPPATRPRTAPA